MEISELVKSLEELQKKVTDMRGLLSLDEKKKQVVELSQEVQKPGFWDKPEEATRVSKELSDLQSEIDTWEHLSQSVTDTLEMAHMDEMGSDANMREELEKQYSDLEKQVSKLEFNTLFNSKHDKKNAIVSIHAGSGGTEAQDWAEMLLRMYLRYCENKGWKTTMLDETRGQEAGIKLATFRVDGRYAYGYLKSEHGTHRLVRISPFDAEKMRHTSFALVEVIPDMGDAEGTEIKDGELRIDTFRASGAGGQNVNKTETAVRITHIPTNISVACQSERSQLQNRARAMRILKAKLHQLEELKRDETKKELRGEYHEARFGNQIRSYVLQPYTLVKDVRTGFETSDAGRVLNGEIEGFVEAYLKKVKR